MAVDVELGSLIHFPWKCSGLTPGTRVSIRSVFRLPTVDPVAWNAQMLAGKLFTVFLGPRSPVSLLSKEIFLSDFPF